MQSSSTWDWSPGKRVVCKTTECNRDIQWREENHASPDGEKVAASVAFGDGEFGMCVNGEVWEETFERVWTVRYGADGRLSAIVSKDMEWYMAVDGETGETGYAFMWDTRISEKGDVIAAPVQQDGEYGMIVNGEPWETMFETATSFALHPQGLATAAVVQTESIPQADTEKFKTGCFTVAVDGVAWDTNYVNCWDPVFEYSSKRVAVQMRTSLYDYSIAVDNVPWAQSYQMVWDPCFNPVSGVVVAPVRQGGKWGMAQDGQLIWPTRYANLWHQQFSADGSKLYAIAATSFGLWTVTVDDKPWSTTFSGSLTDLAVSPDGARAAAIGKNGDKFSIIVDDSVWSGAFPMVWAPVFSPDSKSVAAKVERPGSRFTYMLNGKTYGQDFEQVWDPIFSPEGDKVLLRVVEDGAFTRIVVPVNEF